MRVVGLISGGKDSIYNIMQCISAGHDIDALANLTPDPLTNKNELDSYTFQTVGHEGIDMIADVAGLPLYRQSTLGKSICQSLSYQPTEDDEVEDLYKLLVKVKEETNCNGVAVGAIASDYQRSRVENVCSRLGLTSLCYLWQQNQSELLRSMIEANVTAITIKVASMGLTPSQHLGKSMAELENILSSLNKKFGVNICGEGGEYESYVLDCPLFHEKIILHDTAIVQDSNIEIAASGHLILKSLSKESKYEGDSAENTIEDRLNAVRERVPGPNHYVEECSKEILKPHLKQDDDNIMEDLPTHCEMDGGHWLYGHNIASSTIKNAVNRAQDLLAQSDMSLDDIVFVSLWLRDMADFASINAEYVKCLPGVAPARACVATTLPAATPILMEFIACRKCSESRSVIHIQSVSHWAPANIGPYSQSVKANGFIFVAGQIPLIPGSMALLVGPLDHQLRLSLRHVNRILEASGASLNHIIQVTLFVSNPENISVAIKKLRWILPNRIAVVNAVAVSTLPRHADIEVLAVATQNKVHSGAVQTSIIEGFKCSMEFCYSDSVVALDCRVQSKGEDVTYNEGEIAQIFHKLLQFSEWECGFKIYYSTNQPGLEATLLKAIKGIRVTPVPVLKIADETLFSIVGIGFVR